METDFLNAHLLQFILPTSEYRFVFLLLNIFSGKPDKTLRVLLFNVSSPYLALIENMIEQGRQMPFVLFQCLFMPLLGKTLKIISSSHCVQYLFYKGSFNSGLNCLLFKILKE